MAIVVALCLIMVLAAIAAGAAGQALRGHLEETGGDFGPASVAGHDAELRALIAGARVERRAAHTRE